MSEFLTLFGRQYTVLYTCNFTNCTIYQELNILTYDYMSSIETRAEQQMSSVLHLILLLFKAF